MSQNVLFLQKSHQHSLRYCYILKYVTKSIYKSLVCVLQQDSITLKYAIQGLFQVISIFSPFLASNFNCFGPSYFSRYVSQ